MGKTSRRISEDISLCKQVLQNNNIDEINHLLKHLEITYKMIWKDLRFQGPAGWGDSITDLKGMIGRLEILETFNDNEILGLMQPKGSFSVSSSSQSTSNVNISIEQLFEQTIEQIESNGSIGDDERSNILEKIEELKNIAQTGENRVKKWDMMKHIINWLTTKGVDIGVQVIPLIYKLISTT